MCCISLSKERELRLNLCQGFRKKMCTVWNLLIVFIIADSAYGGEIVYPPGENTFEKWPKGCLKTYGDSDNSWPNIDDYDRINDMPLEPCVHRCRFLDLDCQAFISLQRQCRLFRWKNLDAQQFNYTATSEEMYGLIRDCGFGDDPQCSEQNVLYEGFSQPHALAERGIKECFVRCKMNSKCFFWSYRHISPYPNLNYTCQLFSIEDVTKVTFLLPSDLPPNQMLSSGSRFCREGCFDEGFNYIGQDLKEGIFRGIYDARECRKQCQKVDNCYFFSHNLLSHGCFLKNKYALGGKVFDLKYVSGAKHNYCYNTCFKRGKTVDGHDLVKSPGYIKAQSEDHCSLLCQQKAECFYFTYFPHRSECHLKDIDAIRDVKYDNHHVDVISGSRFAMNCKGCFLESIQIVGQDIRSVRAQSPEECRDWCSRNALCKFFSYHMSRKCELKTGNSKKVQNIYYISGGKGDRDCKHECFSLGYKYSGGSIQTEKVENVDACLDDCLKKDHCEYFTYDIKSGTCFLKHLRQMFQFWNDTNDYISGARYSRNCFRSVTTPNATITTTTVLGETIGSGIAWPENEKQGTHCTGIEMIQSAHDNLLFESVLDCAIYCRTFRECKYYSFSTKDLTCVLLSRITWIGKEAGHVCGRKTSSLIDAATPLSSMETLLLLPFLFYLCASEKNILIL